MLGQLWAAFEEAPQVLEVLKRDYTPYISDYAHEYDQVQVQFRERGATGFMSEPRTREIFVELEYWIEDVIGAKQIREKKADFYKGQPKKW
jgi:hypothetical protein